MNRTQRIAIGTAGTLAVVAGAVWALTLLDEWVGDWGALLWMCGVFLLPFLAGLALGDRGPRLARHAAGAGLAVALVILPSLAVDAARDVQADRALVWPVFGAVAAALGAITYPVGASALANRPGRGDRPNRKEASA